MNRSMSVISLHLLYQVYKLPSSGIHLILAQNIKERKIFQPKVGGVVGCGEGVVYPTSPGRPTDIGL